MLLVREGIGWGFFLNGKVRLNCRRFLNERCASAAIGRYKKLLAVQSLRPGFQTHNFGHDLVVTDLDPPYREFLLRRKRAHRVETPMPMSVFAGHYLIRTTCPPACR